MVSHSLTSVKDDAIELEDDFFHHMKHVMRFKPETQVFLSDPNGYSVIAEITHFTATSVWLKWVADEEGTSELPVDITIVCGLSKGDKLELVVQKATELGVNTIIPFASQYSVVKWDKNKMKKKQVRFQRIAQEAAEQSHRQQIPTVEETMQLNELIEFSKDYTHKLVAYEEAAKDNELGNFAKTLKSMQAGDRLMIVFGPEGGLSPNEITQFQEQGFSLCGLGPRIMRTETAPLYALAAISYQFELLNGGD